MNAVAVLDIGKSNVKLSAFGADGLALETLSTPNVVHDGPPYRHHDLAGLESWLLDGLRALGGRHAIDAVVVCAHGSGGVLVGADGPAMPMIDYEQPVPEDVGRAYRGIAGPYRERGSAIMLGAAHLARQMLWLEMRWPDAFSRAVAFLATPQYWAWRLSGVLSGEVTSLAAQSHLWTPAEGRYSRIVSERRWRSLMPPMRRAWETLGPLAPGLAARTGLSPDTRVLCGVHDSSANFYRYQAAGLRDFTVVSTGTWIATLTDRSGIDPDRERPAHSCNADVFGRPVPCVLAMGGREFAAVAKEAAGPASAGALKDILRTGTFALPSFGSDEGLFPGTARRGRLEGPLAGEMPARFTLAVLYSALLTAECVENLPASSTVVLDGSFVSDPLYCRLVAALLPGRRVLASGDRNGTATGAALLAAHEERRAPAPLSLLPPETAALPDLSSYRADWRARIGESAP